MQFWHCPPPVPQAVFCAPTAQMSFTQQPVGQLEGSHPATGVQLPLPSQEDPGGQLKHPPPPTPQSEPPGTLVTQMPPAQQPSRHVKGLQVFVIGWQVCVPKSHVSPIGQSVQELPPLPHANESNPPWQVPVSSQQPEHVPGPQAIVPMHWPPPTLVT